MGSTRFSICVLSLTVWFGALWVGKEYRINDVTISVVAEASNSHPTATAPAKEVSPSSSARRNLKVKEEVASCSTAERRELARNVETTTPEQWETLTICLVHQLMHEKVGAFIMHVSKSGGTAVGAMLNSKHCWDDPINHQKHGRRGSSKLGFNAAWYRKGSDMPPWAYLRDNLVQGTSCEEMESEMIRTNRIAIESEGVIPFKNPRNMNSGGCPNTLNSMIFRDPLARVESHYKHLHRANPELEKRSKLENGKLNLQFMRDTFDIISDNYYTRSLVGHGFFEWKPDKKTASLSEHPQAWTKVIKAANHSLHSIDWIMLMNSGQAQEEFHRNEIYRYGLGLGDDTKMSKVRVADKAKSEPSIFSGPEKRYLRDLNSLDYKLWEEAKELNRLDNISIERMKPHFDLAVAAASNATRHQEGTQFCCGVVCRNFKTEYSL